ncbi:helix-hairpin-helix domain-containing protein [bacterium]|nr:helix-hairpin-helix domain-containing protein [bacterium]
MLSQREYLAAWLVTAVTIALGFCRLSMGSKEKIIPLRLDTAEVIPLSEGRRKAIDLSTAKIKDLLIVPGLSEKQAEAILKLKDRIRSPQDLLKIKGLDPELILRLSEYLFPKEILKRL